MAMSQPVPLDWDGHPADEPIIANFSLDTALWKRYRCCTCTAVICSTSASTGLCCLLALPYWLCAGSCRSSEAGSFSLYLTPTALHYRMKQYSCGCCCQQTTTKSIPLDKIQDVQLVADCCGDTCGFVREAGRPYRLHIQTAGFSGPEAGAELSVACIVDPEGMRAKVLAAKRALMGPAALGATGAGKDAAAGGATPTMNPLEAAAAAAVASAPLSPASAERVVAVLERIERALVEGLAEARARAGSASGSGTGIGKQ